MVLRVLGRRRKSAAVPQAALRGSAVQQLMSPLPSDFSRPGLSVGPAHRRAELPHNAGEQRSLGAVHDCVLNVHIETVHGACDGAAVLQSCRRRVDLLSHGSGVGPAVAIMDIIGISPSEDNPSRVRMGVAQQLRVEVNIVSVGRIANYAAAIVMLWGLARRTARQIENVSPFYIVVICSQS